MARRAVVPTVVLALLASVPFWAPNRFWVSIATQALIFGIFAMSLDLLLGYGGMASFGHAAFFGAGGYACAVWSAHYAPDLLPILVLGILAGALLAIPIGALALRASGIYFLMLTLALAQLVWGLVSSDTLKRLLGGDIGLVGTGRPDLPLLDQVAQALVLPRGSDFFLLTLIAMVVSFGLLAVVVASPFGKTLEGIREDEHRMMAIGYPTYYYRLAAFVIAGAFAGLAGSLLAAFNFASVAPGQLFWTTSGLVLVAAIIGGARSLLGPLIGAVVVVVLQNQASALLVLVGIQAQVSLLVIGAVFVAFVLFLPGGAISVVRRFL
jgi:branched-chain amino acid transport system permease protein